MSLRLVCRVVSLLVFVTGLVMSSSAMVAWVMEDSLGVVSELGYAAAITTIAGFLGSLIFRKKEGGHIGFREGFAVVTLGWIIVSAFGAIPFMFVADLSFPDAFFETMSGFSTTGASVITEIEALPKGLLFWRALTHWLGGMGIVVLSLAILPVLGIGGMQLFKAEVPGPISDQLTPRIADSAKILWGVYGLLTAVETVCLKIAGMTWFDAVCHSFATLATGGFSTKNSSILYYHTPEFANGVYIDAIITVFMFLAGCNFILHYFALSGKPLAYFKDEEFKAFGKIVLFSSFTIALVLVVLGGINGESFSLGYAIQNASFTVVSIITTTGFCTGDFNVWPQFARILLLGLMFVGGCGGSTGGGMKVSRVLLLVRYGQLQLKRCFFPHMVSNVQLNSTKVGSPILHRTLSFFFIFIFIFALVALLLTILEPDIDLETAVSASIATLGNIGPGLNNVGATTNYAHFGDPAKLLLSFAMLIGRLEIYTVLVLLVPAFWKRKR